MIEYVGVFVICFVGSAATGFIGYLRGRSDATRDLTRRERMPYRPPEDKNYGYYGCGICEGTSNSPNYWRGMLHYRCTCCGHRWKTLPKNATNELVNDLLMPADEPKPVV